MSQKNFIVREPILDPKQQVIGYELLWQSTGSREKISADQELAELISVISRQLNDDKGCKLLGSLLFVEVTPALLSAGVQHALSAANTVLILDKARYSSAELIGISGEVRGQGFGILLRNANVRSPNKELMSHVTHIEIRCGEADVSKLAKAYAALKHSSSVHMVASHVSNWQEFEVCSSLGLDAFVGKLHLTPREGRPSKGMNSSQALILQLMDQVRKNAEISQLETLIKRDAALSYKLLRYINSAGFGLGREIQSLKHAVAMIGYSPLYRWLSLLLATASTSEQAAVLMQTAIIRGRMVELLAKDRTPKSDAENLFVTGMFSLLDRLLGVPMEEVLGSIQLPEIVKQALLSREGTFGPYLALAEACELRNGFAGALADMLSFSSSQVNEAHLEAISWSQNFRE